VLGFLLHAPRGPFYSPKAARSRWRPTRKAKVAFCRVAHQTVRCTTGKPLFMSGARSPSYFGADDRCRFAAVRCTPTVRCPCRPLQRATRRPRIARSTVALAAVGSPDSPVNYSCTPPNSPESGLFTGGWPGAPDSPVHHRTVQCAKLS
jgi:hypothetical protein